jgi:hypothetical protein
MQIDIRPLLRKLLLAGLPLAPAACGRDPLAPIERGDGGLDAVVAISNGACVGDWKVPPQSCGSPVVTVVPLDPKSPSQQKGYEACLLGLDCKPLCRELLPGGGTVISCETACLQTNQRAARITQSPNCAVGRLTEGVAVGPSQRGTTLAAHLAELAALEGAAVPAFRRLARELDAHGAPAAFVTAARRSAGEEVRHHALMTAAAGAVGGRVERVRAPALPTRSLGELLHENGLEGCVRETFGALLASWQAATAEDPQLRRMMTGIAADETAHAALSWRIHAWGARLLSAVERRRLAEEMAAAYAEVAEDVATPILRDERERRAFGLPTPEAAVALARALGVAIAQA